MLGFGSKLAIEEEMADWLAHPNEFGVRPKTVRFKRTYKAELVTHGKLEIHLVEYTRPDDTTGRGFESSAEEARYLAGKQQQGLTDIEVTDRLKIATSEITEFRAKSNGTPVSGAGDTSVEGSRRF